MTDKDSTVEVLRAALLHGNDISAGDDFVFLDALHGLIPLAEAMERVVEAARSLISYGWWDSAVKPYTDLLALEHALQALDAGPERNATPV